MHVFPLIDFGHPEPHNPTELCRCQPTPQLDIQGKLNWIHKPFEPEGGYYATAPEESEALDLIAQAEAINQAESVRLWEAAERKKLKVTVIPFQSLNPIHLPKSHPRI